MRRYVYLGIALGLTVLLFGGIASLPACYDVPQPTCGFRCGPDGECPADYTCSSLEPRCHLNGTDPAMRCDPFGDDAGVDAADAPPDVLDADDAPGDGDAADAPDDGPTDADAPADTPADAVDAPADV